MTSKAASRRARKPLPRYPIRVGCSTAGPRTAPRSSARRRSKPSLRRLRRTAMEQRTEPGLSPYRIFSRAEWAALRADTPMTLRGDEMTRLRSLHDRLDMSEVEDIYLPLSRLL